MIVRKPGVIFATCNCLHSATLAAGISSTSSTPDRRPGTRHTQCTTRNPRKYATIAGASENGSSEKQPRSGTNHVWPQPLEGQSHPTPYQIFSLKQNAPYSKSRFYELVKIYHPDISPSPDTTLSHAVKVERYRLIVAANSILCDPEKRRAYDRFGAGWNGRAEASSSWHRGSSSSPGPFTHSWNNPADPIHRNATWEDWEKFYARRAQENGSGEYPPAKRAPVYMANTYFLALVVALSIVGSSLNYGRAQDAGTYFIEQRDLVHDRSAKDLRKVKREVSSFGSKESRIEFFVRQREATMGPLEEVEALREEKAGRVLADKEYCSSEEMKERET